MNFKQLQYGFEWGGMTVCRISSELSKGWVVLQVSSAKTNIEIYCTKTGKIRIYRDGKELI
jgi:hypothetical protein